jgi:hypothetical protein
VVKLTVQRLTKSAELPTYGVLIREDGVPFALTLERPWLQNQKGKSCIPAGAYTAKRHQSPKFGETFWVQDVPGRSEILFHKGNIDDDSHGCILVGEQFNPVKGEDGITASKEGFEEFMRLLAGLSEVEVSIIDPLYAGIA